MARIVRLAPPVLLALATLAACGDDTVLTGESSAVAETTAPAAPVVVLRYALDGGCVVLGPNCPTYTVWSDGRVDVSRTGVDGDPEVTGSVPATAVDEWRNATDGLDPDVLATEVGPGVCNSCVDGADITLTVTMPDGEIVLESTELEFDPQHPLFAALETLMVQVRAVGELPLIEQG